MDFQPFQRALRERFASLADRWTRARALAATLLRALLPSEAQHLFALTLVVGVVCGLLAVAFHLAIRGAEALLIERAQHAEGAWGAAAMVLLPALGGLVAGALLTWVVPGARGSGIPQVKAAFALGDGRVRFRDAFGKFWLATLQIGSGASLGREGPTVQICAGATTLLGRLTGLPPKSRRRLLPVGVAAGIAAAFNAPIAAVTFTIEEIVGSLDHAVLSGVVVAAALAAVIERQVLGVHPVIETAQAYGLDHASSLVFFALLGLAGALVSVLFTDGLLRTRAAFRGFTRLPAWTHPALGGLLTGLLALGVSRGLSTTGVNGGGYATLGRALAGELTLEVLLVLCGVKLAATVFSYSSGGAGGIFAPSLFVGAMLGGAFGYLDVAAFGHEPRQLGAFALVGMGAVFAGVIRAPMTSVLIIFEMTGGYGLVLPLMLANMTSYLLARHLRPTPIYEALLEQDGITLPHGEPPPRHPLDVLTAADVMTQRVLSASAAETAATVTARLDGVPFELVPVLDADAVLLGAVSVSALRAAPPDTPVKALVQRIDTIEPSASLSRAAAQMNDRACRKLVVVDGRRAVGILSISDLVRAHGKLFRPSTGEAPPQRADGLEALTAKDLSTRAPVVAPTLRLDTLVETLTRTSAGLVVVGTRAQPAGVVLLEHVRDFLLDAPLQHMLVASDFARPAPVVPPEARFTELAERLSATSAEALLVAPVDDVEAHVVLRATLGDELLDRFGARA